VRRPLYGWLTAEAVSLTGTRISMIAIPWFVLTTTGSVTQTGLVAFAEMTPMVLLMVLGGPVIDRLGPRRVAVACDLGSSVAVALIPILYAVGLLTFPILLAVVGLAGALRGPGDVAKYSLVPSVTQAAGVSTERVTGIESSVERTASMFGAAVGGALIAGIGPTNALVVDAVSFLLSAGVLAWSTVGIEPVPAKTGVSEPYRRRMAEGWRFLRREPVLLGLSLMVAATNLLDLAWVAVLLPMWARDSGRTAAAIGLVLAVFAGASVLGSLVAAGWGERMPRYRVYLMAFLVTGAPRFVAFALDTPLWALLAVMVLGGFFSGFLNPILGAVFFERIPASMVGRVNSLSTSMAFALMPFGGLLGGALIAGLRLDPALLVVGLAYFLVTIGPAVAVPGYRDMDRHPNQSAPVEVG
jgi:MFS family permease